MSPIEYDAIISKFLDTILEKSYSGEIKWFSSINSNGLIKHETLFTTQGIVITCVVIEPSPRVNIYISIENTCIKVDWNLCELVRNSTVESKAYELKSILESYTNKSILSKLQDLTL